MLHLLELKKPFHLISSDLSNSSHHYVSASFSVTQRSLEMVLIIQKKYISKRNVQNENGVLNTHSVRIMNNE